MFVVGVDISTQATKVVVVDLESGEIVSRGKSTHTVTGEDGARESDPRQWWQALGEALASAGPRREIVGIGVAGQQHGLVVLDGAGVPVRPAMLWNDTRSAPDAEHLIDALGGAGVWAERIGLVPVASFTATKWSWLTHNHPQDRNRAAAVMLPHDYLNLRLVGEPLTDRGDASGTGWWAAPTEDYSDQVLGLIGLDRRLLPGLVPPGEPAGRLSEGAADDLGLPKGIVVSGGTGDNMGAGLGLGLRPGQAVISLGTSGTAYAVSSTRVADPSGTVAGFATADQGFLPLAATLNCTLAVDRIAGWLGLERDKVSNRTEVVVLPYLDGERTPNLPRAAGTILGLRHDTTAEEILLAAYQGAVASLLDALARIHSHGSGIEPESPLILTGGGARGATWRRVVAEMSGRPVLVPDEEEMVAVGAAVQAASVVGEEQPSDVAGRWRTTRGAQVEPSSHDSEILARILETRDRATPILGD